MKKKKKRKFREEKIIASHCLSFIYLLGRNGV
jgi:hypothetical protein